MSEVQLPPDEDVVTVCLADVPRRPRRAFASVAAMGEATAAAWDRQVAIREVSALILGPEEDDDDPPCEMCGHSYAQKHRIVPGSWGGTYHPSNVVHLCPNHHAMIHLRLKHHQDPDSLSEGEWNRLDDAMHDPGINRLWADRVKAVSIQRLIDLGFYEGD